MFKHSFLTGLVAVILIPAFAFGQSGVIIQNSITFGGTVTIAVGTPPAPAFQITGPLGEPSGVVGTSYSSTACTTINGTAPVTFATSTTIPGLSFSTSTCVYSGTPTTAGTYTFTITATDNLSHVATTSLNIQIQNAPPPGGGHNEDCNSSGAWTGASSKPLINGSAAAPANCMYTALSSTPSPGTTVTVTPGSCTSLQSAITNATAGQTIIIPALNGGVQDVFTNCSLAPSAAGNQSNWITVETDQMASLPPEGTRITPAWAGLTSLPGRDSFMQPAIAGVYVPKIITNGNFTIRFNAGAAYWRFIGLEITSTNGRNAAALIDNNGRVNHLIFDRLLIHGGNSPNWQDKDDVQGGIAFGQGNYEALIDSYNGDTHCSGACAQSIGVALGGNATAIDGPFKVTNNYLESAGEVLFSGGGGQAPPAVIYPSTDVEIRLNHVFKPLFWKAGDPSYFGKWFELDNLMELKNTQRAWIEGNVFENSTGAQGTQQGNAIIFVPRNQSKGCCSGSANADGTGNVTWVSGTQFNSALTSPNCGVKSGHCLFIYAGLAYQVANFLSTTQVTLQLCGPNGGCPNAGGRVAGATLPTGTSQPFSAYDPGLNPNAVDLDIIFINNAIHGAARGMSIAIAVSDGGDLPLSEKRLFIQNNLFDGIDGWLWNNNAPGACCVWGTGFQIQGITSASVPDFLVIDHNTLTEYLTGGNPGVGPDFMWGFNTTQAMTSFQVSNNISAGGLHNPNGDTAENVVINAATLAGRCFDHNMIAGTSNPFGPNGKGTFANANNPPYPVAADSGGCPFTANGNLVETDFNAILFTANNGGTNINAQLQSGSPGHLAASDGTDIGVNWTNLQNALSLGSGL